MTDVNKANYKNPKEIIIYTQKGRRSIRSGKKHDWFQFRCKPEDLK